MKEILRKGVMGVSLFHLFTLSLLLVSCGDETEIEGEFDNWEEKNEAVLAQWGSDASYRKIPTYTINADVQGLTNDNYIYVEVLESGNGTESPLFTDTVRVAYRGHLIPTESYPEGKVFDQTYVEDFRWDTARQTDFVTMVTVDGFATALMNMHVGDRWRVRIPYILGYGTTSTNSVAGYSNLVFEIALYDFWHPGETRPAAKSR
jgi:FKBP-type peptidyl-prolyl cis-trans isomerase FklB